MKNNELLSVSIDARNLLELIHWARRYADKRCTYVPDDFNRIYNEIMSQYPLLKEHEFLDKTLAEDGKYFPYATIGIVKHCF